MSNFLSIVCLLFVTCIASATLHSFGGQSTSFRKQDDHGNYKFSYHINDGYGGKNYRQEHGDGYGNTKGSYGLVGPDGRVRHVDYVADAYGFRAKVNSNEPGVGGKDSAHVSYNGGGYLGYKA